MKKILLILFFSGTLTSAGLAQDLPINPWASSTNNTVKITNSSQNTKEKMTKRKQRSLCLMIFIWIILYQKNSKMKSLHFLRIPSLCRVGRKRFSLHYLFCLQVFLALLKVPPFQMVRTFCNRFLVGNGQLAKKRRILRLLILLHQNIRLTHPIYSKK